LPTRLLAALLGPERARHRARVDTERFLALAATPVDLPEQALERVEWLAAQVPPRVMARVLPPAAAGIFSLALARRLARRAGVERDAMAVTGGLPHNVTTEMNLELWTLAQRLRQGGFQQLLEQEPASELAASYLADRL